jgi:hypothetical protein
MKSLKQLMFSATLALTMSALGTAQVQQTCTTTGAWTTCTLINTVGGTHYAWSIASPLLLTDGRVMVQFVGEFEGLAHQFQDWYALTPDDTNSYVNGSWTELASLYSLESGHPPVDYAPAAFASAVLADGKVIIEGGEDNNGQRVETASGALYDPAQNLWTFVSPPSGWSTIGDAPSTVLPNKSYLLGNACSNQTALFTESAGWISSGQEEAWGAEAGYNLLPSGNVLTIDTCQYGNGCQNNQTPYNSELYTTSLGTWSSAGSTTLPLSTFGGNSCLLNGPVFGEMGPAILRPDGTVFATGGDVPNTAIYYTTSFSGMPPCGTAPCWSAGPTLPSVSVPSCSDPGPYPLQAADLPAALLVNGTVLFAAAALVPQNCQSPVYLFEWNGSSLTQLANTPGISYQPEMLVLPTGQILVTSVSWGSSNVYFIYTPGVSAYGGIAPVISSVPSPLTLGSTSNLIQGSKFNGYSQGSEFGDDFQNATNYPLVQITDSNNHVFYAKTHDHSTMAVSSPAPAFTRFDVPSATSGIATGPATLVVIANGIPSIPVQVTLTAGTEDENKRHSLRR